MPTAKKPPVRPARRQSAPKPAPEPSEAERPRRPRRRPPAPGLRADRRRRGGRGVRRHHRRGLRGRRRRRRLLRRRGEREGSGARPRRSRPRRRPRRARPRGGRRRRRAVHAPLRPAPPFRHPAARDGRVTAADLFLARFEADLPKEAVRAVKALIRAEDTVARATWEGKDVTIEDLSTGRALPGPALWRRGTRPFVCRLVRYGSVHVPSPSSASRDAPPSRRSSKRCSSPRRSPATS